MTGQDSTGPGDDLEAIRRDIDAIDDALVTLLERRFMASERVKLVKALAPASGSPFRPAREAAIMRRLLARTHGRVPADLLVRLWRLILTASSQRQTEVTIHIPRKLSGSIPLRLRLRDHFGTMPIEEYRDEAQALMQIDGVTSDICVVETTTNWIEPYLAGAAGKARVIGMLPAIHESAEPPKMLIIGHAPDEPTGDDQTLVVSTGKLPRDFARQPVWDTKVGEHRLSCLPGFLSEHESPIVALVRSNPQLKLTIAGRYPAPFGVSQ